MSTIYDFSARDIHGADQPLSAYRGRVLLVVNVASKCGFTPQYSGLEDLYRALRDDGLTVLGFPCDQFGRQEPGNEAEILDFCTTQYDITFPLFAKIDVNGADADPLYRWLKGEKPGVFGTEGIKWNFTKFLVGRDGQVIKRYAPTDTPAGLKDDIVRALAAPAARIALAWPTRRASPSPARRPAAALPSPPPSAQRRQPAAHRVRLDDSGVGLGELGHALQDAVQVGDRAQHHARDEAVVARDLVAFHELRDLLDQPLDPPQLARQRPDAHDRLERVAQRHRVHVQGIGADHARFLQPPQAVGHARRGHADLARQVGGGGARVGRQRLDQAAVDTIQDGVFIF